MLKILKHYWIEMEPIGGIGFMGAGVGTDAKTAAEM
jgi:hypothetical protein